MDGTKEFINQRREFTVNIALIENNEPILGVIYAPSLSILYYASKNNGSYKLSCDQKINSLSDSIEKPYWVSWYILWILSDSKVATNSQ